jgi:hypothetical protein
MYVTAWVSEYEDMRTFALERISTLAMLSEHFEMRTLPPEPFANSLGAFLGRPELVEIEFDAAVADYVAAREWHRSQEITVRDDGSTLMRLCVSNDTPLRTWILGFGGAVRVVTPLSLARDIFEEIQSARERYMPKLRFEMLRVLPPEGGSHESNLRSRQLPFPGGGPSGLTTPPRLLSGHGAGWTGSASLPPNHLRQGYGGQEGGNYRLISISTCAESRRKNPSPG